MSMPIVTHLSSSMESSDTVIARSSSKDRYGAGESNSMFAYVASLFPAIPFEVRHDARLYTGGPYSGAYMR